MSHTFFMNKLLIQSLFFIGFVLAAPTLSLCAQPKKMLSGSASSASTLIEIIKVNPTIKLDIRYATTNNFMGKVLYPSARCYLRASVAEKLNRVQKELRSKGLGLKIFDAYRPLSVQKKLWDACPDERYVAHPKKGSKHNRGSAVDLTLIDLKTEKELEMPSAFDDFTAKAHRVYSAMRSDIVRKNCRLLEDVMVKHGFVPYKYEWWHFDDSNWELYDLLDVSFDALK